MPVIRGSCLRMWRDKTGGAGLPSLQFHCQGPRAVFRLYGPEATPSASGNRCSSRLPRSMCANAWRRPSATLLLEQWAPLGSGDLVQSPLARRLCGLHGADRPDGLRGPAARERALDMPFSSKAVMEAKRGVRRSCEPKAIRWTSRNCSGWSRILEPRRSATKSKHRARHPSLVRRKCLQPRHGWIRTEYGVTAAGPS